MSIIVSLLLRTFATCLLGRPVQLRSIADWVVVVVALHLLCDVGLHRYLVGELGRVPAALLAMDVLEVLPSRGMPGRLFAGRSKRGLATLTHSWGRGRDRYKSCHKSTEYALIIQWITAYPTAFGPGLVQAVSICRCRLLKCVTSYLALLAAKQAHTCRRNDC